ncbi:MAG: transposase [Chloroflexi bacterium]|nr:transposase [Chloroflexota bacterium]
MDLTDEQWQVVEPLLSAPKPAAPGRGRPPQDARAILNGVLWKMRAGAAWTVLPAAYPSHQTCYRYYRVWKASGLLQTIIAALHKDLIARGRLDPSSALRQGQVRVVSVAGKITFIFSPRLRGAWQASIATILLRMAYKKVAKRFKSGQAISSD